MKQMTQSSAKKSEKEQVKEKKVPVKPVKLNKDYQQEMDDESDTDSEVKAITDK